LSVPGVSLQTVLELVLAGFVRCAQDHSLLGDLAVYAVKVVGGVLTGCIQTILF